MKLLLNLNISLLLVVLVYSCQPAANKNNNAHGHAHDAHGNHIETRPVLSQTIWTDKTELFVEFPAFVVGKTSSFAAHFTQLKGHKAISDGSVTVSLIKGGKGLRNTAQKPSSPGIFRTALKPNSPGIYQLVFEVSAKNYHDKILIPNVRVFKSEDEAGKESIEKENPNEISFLKEQAWKIAFQTQKVEVRDVYDVIATSGTWRATEEANRKLVASANGIVDFIRKELIPGSEVKKGETLFAIGGNMLTENNLRAELTKAASVFQQAKAAYERKEKLHQSEIISKAEFELVKSEYEQAKAHYEALQKDYKNGVKLLKAPFDGIIKQIGVRNGDFINEGTTMLTISQPNARLLECQVSQMYSIRKENIFNIWYALKGKLWSDLASTEGTVLTVGNMVSKEQPNVLVYAKVNEAVNSPEGALIEVQIGYGNAVKRTVVPIEALLEDYGQYSVIVQVSGESFERRTIETGRQNGDWIEVLKGLEPGEVVVTKGAYQVKMASMSGKAPAHGHEH